MSTCETPAHFAGWGSDVPSAVVGNEELEQRFGVDEGWIHSKTGIGARRVVAPEQSSAETAPARSSWTGPPTTAPGSSPPTSGAKAHSRTSWEFAPAGARCPSHPKSSPAATTGST